MFYPHMSSPAALALLTAIALVFSAAAFAGGDKNAHNNPSGEPDDESFEMPFLNMGDGRVMVFCAEDELLVITPVNSGAADAVCIPDDEL